LSQVAYLKQAVFFAWVYLSSWQWSDIHQQISLLPAQEIR
jgi:hypothetical protein